MARMISVATVIFLLLAGCTSVALADIFNGYDYGIRQITMSEIDQPWTFQATTTDPRVVQVTVTWYRDYFGAGDQVEKQVITGSFTFEATFIPREQGWWFVTFQFQDKNGNDLDPTSELELIGTPSHIINNFVPEVPLLGTAGVATAMLLGFAVYKKRKKQN